MTKLQFILIILIVAGCSEKKTTNSDLPGKLSAQLNYALELSEPLRDSMHVSPRTIEDGKLKLVAARDWTSGFFPGNLWMMYELTADEHWKSAALKYTLPLEQQKWNGGTHDMGFKMFCSFGKAYQITGNEEYKNILIQSAKTLATRFNPKVGCIRSWDHNADKWDFPVIIDNMMNLELLMWASKETGDSVLSNIAITHARTTMKNHFRDDFLHITLSTIIPKQVKSSTGKLTRDFPMKVHGHVARPGDYMVLP